MKNKSKKSKAMKVVKTKLTPDQKFGHALEDYLYSHGVMPHDGTGSDIDGDECDDLVFEDLRDCIVAQVDYQIASHRLTRSRHEETVDNLNRTIWRESEKR